MTGTDHADGGIAFDDDWAARAAERLDETEFDTELGLAMARDAQRVVAGEMSEQAFYEAHHEAVAAEFGEDERVLEARPADDGDADGGDGPRLPGVPSDVLGDEASRRAFVKKGGLVAMGLSMVAGGPDDRSSTAESEDLEAAAEAHAPAATGEGTRWGMVINLNNCDGCLDCVVACKGLHGSSRGAHWIYVMTYADPDQDHENFFVRTCMHCGNAPCEKVCPVGARHTREEDGLVLTDYDICIGCRYCMVSCPYGANYFQWGEPDSPRENEHFTHDGRGRWVDGPPPVGAMGKCTFEPAWQDGQAGEKLVGRTMCEMACDRDAIHFGDMNDPDSDPNRHLREYLAANPNDRETFADRPPDTATTFRALDERGTEPGVVFIGNEPSVHAEQVEGPVTYEDRGLIDHRKRALEEGAPGSDLA